VSYFCLSKCCSVFDSEIVQSCGSCPGVSVQTFTGSGIFPVCYRCAFAPLALLYRCSIAFFELSNQPQKGYKYN
jgi:hypothetical protein